MIKNYLCKVNPIKLTMAIVLITILSIEAYVMGIGTFFALISIFMLIMAIVVLFGFGLYKLIVNLQARCKQ